MLLLRIRAGQGVHPLKADDAVHSSIKGYVYGMVPMCQHVMHGILVITSRLFGDFRVRMRHPAFGRGVGLVKSAILHV